MRFNDALWGFAVLLLCGCAKESEFKTMSTPQDTAALDYWNNGYWQDDTKGLLNLHSLSTPDGIEARPDGAFVGRYSWSNGSLAFEGDVLVDWRIVCSPTIPPQSWLEGATRPIPREPSIDPGDWLAQQLVDEQRYYPKFQRLKFDGTNLFEWEDSEGGTWRQINHGPFKKFKEGYYVPQPDFSPAPQE